MARPTKLTSKVRDLFMEAIRVGAAYEHAAGYAGIDESTFYRWRDRGEAEIVRVAEDGRRSVLKEEEPFVEFCKELKRAEGAAVVTWLRTLDKAAEGIKDEHGNAKPSVGHWQAHAWKLERRHPGDYSRRERHELTGQDGGPVETRIVFGYDDEDPEGPTDAR